MLSREDLLQELELLPVWQLRNPVPEVAVAVAPATEAVAVVSEPMKIDTVPPVIASAEQGKAEEQAEPVLAASFRLIMSDDGLWAFILAAVTTAETDALLHNMLKAVSVTPNQDVAEAQTTLLDQALPKVIVVMGETEAQQLLNVEDTLVQLRGKTHLYQQVPVVVTYPPSHLLSHGQDKAKAWEDLCLAKLTIANL